MAELESSPYLFTLPKEPVLGEACPGRGTLIGMRRHPPREGWCSLEEDKGRVGPFCIKEESRL